MLMRKHFILSTRTLVSKRDVTQSFGSDNNVYVPFEVIEEIENRYYDQMNDRGKIARHTLEYLGSFHIAGLKRGVTQKNGSVLRVITTDDKPEYVSIECNKLDRKILEACLKVKKNVPDGEPVILVSKKASLRKKAEMLGIKGQTFRDELLPEIAEQYTGRNVVEVADSKLKKFRENRELPAREVFSEEMKDVFENMFVTMKAKTIGQEYGRVYKGKIIPLSTDGKYPYKVIPKNEGQRFMIEALMMDAEIAPLVIIKGPAGTGKTFLSMAAGLEHLDNGEFPKNILISRAAVEVGEKLGYLPGGESEKMGPYARGIKDNVEKLLNMKNNKSDKGKKPEQRRKVKVSYAYHEADDEDEKPDVEDGTIFFENGLIRLEAVNFIRGRSIAETYMVIDEAQNLTPNEVKTIITRVDEGTKLILMGDPAQIDRPELDERNNGISYASERMKGDKTCWQITMREEESVRSELAKRASMLL